MFFFNVLLLKIEGIFFLVYSFCPLTFLHSYFLPVLPCNICLYFNYLQSSSCPFPIKEKDRILSPPIQRIPFWVLYSVFRILQPAFCLLYSIVFILHSIFCILHFTFSILHSAFLFCILFSASCLLYSAF